MSRKGRCDGVRFEIYDAAKRIGCWGDGEVKVGLSVSRSVLFDLLIKRKIQLFAPNELDCFYLRGDVFIRFGSIVVFHTSNSTAIPCGLGDGGGGGGVG